MFSSLDPVLHSQVRLAIMSILIGVKEAGFNYMLEHIDTTKGNLSFQISKLKEVGYIRVNKSFKGNYPLTTCKITSKGIEAYEIYVNAMEEYFQKFKDELNSDT